MRSSIRKTFALLVAGLGLSAAAATAGPKDNPPPKGDPKPPMVQPKFEPKPLPKPAPAVPKFEPKPVPPPTPKADPIKPPMGPKVDPFKPPIGPKVDPIKPPVPTPPKAEPKFPAKPVDPVKPTLPKADPKVTLPPVKKPEVKLPPVVHKPIVVEKPKAGPIELPKGPGLKLPAGTKFDQAGLAKVKPPIDLTKTKPEAVLAAKPPANFKAKPIKLDQIHLPKDAPVVEKLNITSVKNVQVNQQFVMNKGFYKGGDYHLKCGTKTAFGYCYPGKVHCHWHHCIWDPCFSCHYFYCPSTCGYYYWCATDVCYYPCHWFVEHHNCCYPWWICGGFGGYGYAAKPSFGIYIGW